MDAKRGAIQQVDAAMHYSAGVSIGGQNRLACPKRASWPWSFSTSSGRGQSPHRQDCCKGPSPQSWLYRALEISVSPAGPKATTASGSPSRTAWPSFNLLAQAARKRGVRCHVFEEEGQRAPRLRTPADMINATIFKAPFLAEYARFGGALHLGNLAAPSCEILGFGQTCAIRAR